MSNILLIVTTKNTYFFSIEKEIKKFVRNGGIIIETKIWIIVRSRKVVTAQRGDYDKTRDNKTTKSLKKTLNHM